MPYTQRITAWPPALASISVPLHISPPRGPATPVRPASPHLTARPHPGSHMHALGSPGRRPAVPPLQAEHVVVAMGSGVQPLEAAVRHLSAQGKRVGVLKVRGHAGGASRLWPGPAPTHPLVQSSSLHTFQRLQGGTHCATARHRPAGPPHPPTHPPAAPAGASVPPLVCGAPAGGAAGLCQAHLRAGPHQGAWLGRRAAAGGRLLHPAGARAPAAAFSWVLFKSPCRSVLGAGSGGSQRRAQPGAALGRRPRRFRGAPCPGATCCCGLMLALRSALCSYRAWAAAAPPCRAPLAACVWVAAQRGWACDWPAASLHLAP